MKRWPRAVWYLIGTGLVAIVLFSPLALSHIRPHPFHWPRLDELITQKVLERLLFELTLGKAGAAANALLQVIEWIAWLEG